MFQKFTEKEASFRSASYTIKRRGADFRSSVFRVFLGKCLTSKKLHNASRCIELRYDKSRGVSGRQFTSENKPDRQWESSISKIVWEKDASTANRAIVWRKVPFSVKIWALNRLTKSCMVFKLVSACPEVSGSGTISKYSQVELNLKRLPNIQYKACEKKVSTELVVC